MSLWHVEQSIMAAGSKSQLTGKRPAVGPSSDAGRFALLHARFLALGQQHPYDVGRSESFFARKSIRSLVIFFDKDGAGSVFRTNAPNARKSFPASFRAHGSEQAFL